MRWRRHETIEKSRRLLGFALDGQGVHAREWSGFRGKADIGVVSNALRCVEAANGYTRLVHKIKTCVRKRKRFQCLKERTANPATPTNSSQISQSLLNRAESVAIYGDGYGVRNPVCRDIISQAYPITNLLKQAISCDEGNYAAEMRAEQLAAQRCKVCA